MVGILGIAAALEGWLAGPMPWYQRIISAVGGLLLIYPGTATDLIGIVLVGAVALVQVSEKRKASRVLHTDAQTGAEN